MPKVKYIWTPQSQRDIFNEIVEIYMAKMRIRTQAALADRLSMNRSVLNKRLQHGGWSDVELWTLIRTLKIEPEDVARMMAA